MNSVETLTSMDQAVLIAELKNELSQYKKKMKEICSSKTELETKSLIEIMAAEMEHREPEEWAQEFIEYQSTTNPQYF